MSDLKKRLAALLRQWANKLDPPPKRGWPRKTQEAPLFEDGK